MPQRSTSMRTCPLAGVGSGRSTTSSWASVQATALKASGARAGVWRHSPRGRFSHRASIRAVPHRQEARMDDALAAILDELHSDGRAHDATKADRLQRLRNLEPDTARLLAV